MAKIQEKPTCCFLKETGKKGQTGKDLYFCTRRKAQIAWPNGMCTKSKCNMYFRYYSPETKSDETGTDEELNTELTTVENIRCKIFINPEQYVTSIYLNQRLW